MNRIVQTNRVEESHEAYQQRRAKDKYEGKGEKAFPLEQFRKGADYLAVVFEKSIFDEEDLGDMVRVALSRSKPDASPADDRDDRKVSFA
jgi:hypothetical protein